MKWYMPRFIQTFTAKGIEVCISDGNMTIWEGEQPPREVELTKRQSELYYLSMRNETFSFELLKLNR